MIICTKLIKNIFFKFFLLMLTLNFIFLPCTGMHLDDQEKRQSTFKISPFAPTVRDKNSYSHAFYYAAAEHAIKEEEKEQWKRKIGYKDDRKYMSQSGEAKEEFYREKDFVISAVNGNLERCRSFLERGVDINANNARGNALGAAARNNHIALCKFLISRGAMIDLFNIHGETPLMLAVEAGNIETCEVLIHLGANVNVRNPENNQTLRDYANNYYYNKNKKMEIINLLEEHGLQKPESKENKTLNGDLSSVGQEFNQSFYIDSGTSSWCPIL
jgi:hypothetical protein